MVLVRPETVELQPANGDGSGVITGEIVSHTFLGADDAAEADLRRQRGDGRRAGHAGERLSGRHEGAGALPRRDGAGAHASKRLQQQIRTVAEDPVDAEGDELAHPRWIVDRVDRRLQAETARQLDPAPPRAPVPEADPPRVASRPAGSRRRGRRAAASAARAPARSARCSNETTIASAGSSRPCARRHRVAGSATGS